MPNIWPQLAGWAALLTLLAVAAALAWRGHESERPKREGQSGAAEPRPGD